MRQGFRMTIAPDLGEVARVNAAFAEYAEANGVPAAEHRRVQVALDELLTNTITYGKSRDITMEAELTADSLLVRLSDDGTAFDPLIQISPDTTLSVDLRRIGGLGIHLVRQMMDEVSYDRLANRNVVTLTRKVHGRHDPHA
jgi:anti-sigma regulatory factor (Ser/Thr protein kinase)